jgi:hypothetical protein
MFNPIKFIEPIANSNSSSLHTLIAPGSNLPQYPRGSMFFSRGEPRKILSNDKHMKMKFINGLVNCSGSADLVIAFIAKYPKWKYMPDVTVDHDSQIRCPKKSYCDIDYAEFVLQFFDIILRDDIDVMIAGDEYITDKEVKGLNPHPMNELYTFMKCDNTRVVRHSAYGWVLYRTQYSDYDPVKMVVQMRESAEIFPSACDMKITNYCTNRCKWCYQNSDKCKWDEHEGAPLERMKEFVERNSNIVEYALGGGDPTGHPKFRELVQFIHNSGRLVNFTTRDLHQLGELMDVPFDAVATSADSIDELIDRAGSLHMFNIMASYRLTKNVHLIAWPHIVSEIAKDSDRVHDALSRTECNLVLLAPKLGTNPAAKSYWKSSLRKAGGRAVYDRNMVNVLTGNKWLMRCTAVDTPIMREYKKHINFNEMYHFTTEGDMSIYYDAVNDRMYNSSYELVPFSYTKKQQKILQEMRWQ